MRWDRGRGPSDIKKCLGGACRTLTSSLLFFVFLFMIGWMGLAHRRSCHAMLPHHMPKAQDQLIVNRKLLKANEEKKDQSFSLCNLIISGFSL